MSEVMALDPEERNKWLKAAQEELQSLVDNGTFELVLLPPGRKAIGSKWVFRVKHNADGSIMIDDVRNQSFIMGWTSCHWPVTLVDVRGKNFQTQKAFDYKKIDAQLQIYLLWQHSFRVRVRICYLY